MKILLVGFDSAWAGKNSGGLVGVLQTKKGEYELLDEPVNANFTDATRLIHGWQQKEKSPVTTIVMLDQPIVVRNPIGRRPVESIISSPVGRRYGGVQPANTGNEAMFGKNTPVRSFLKEFGGPADPTESAKDCRVFETYPALTMIALGWELEDERQKRPAGRLPKYNPRNRNNFSIEDWKHVCNKVGCAFKCLKIIDLSEWAFKLAKKPTPKKCDQDKLDACLCLLVGLHYAKNKPCLMVGQRSTGYVLVPNPVNRRFPEELKTHCEVTSRKPSEWIRIIHRRGGPS